MHFTIRPRSNFILWDKLVNEPELVKDLHIGNDIDPSIRQSIINIIQKNWDSFYKRGVSQPMLYLEFYIDTGNSPPVCCIQPVYGFHESKIMTKLINNLEESDLIFDCEGASESLLLLTAKPHQESC